LFLAPFGITKWSPARTAFSAEKFSFAPLLRAALIRLLKLADGESYPKLSCCCIDSRFAVRCLSRSLPGWCLERVPEPALARSSAAAAQPVTILVAADAVAGSAFPAARGIGDPLSRGRLADCGTQTPTWSAPQPPHTRPASMQTLAKVRRTAFRVRFPSVFPRCGSRNMPARPQSRRTHAPMGTQVAGSVNPTALVWGLPPRCPGSVPAFMVIGGYPTRLVGRGGSAERL
jgi:hypothetical protein